MAFDFPANPIVDQEFVDTATGGTYIWNGYAWTRKGGGTSAGGNTGIEEAPIDSVPYARRNAAWVPADLMTADRPILNTITPSTGTGATAITVVLAGSKFSVTAKVYFGNELMPSAFVSPSQMSFPIIPANHTVGVHAVTVNNTGLTSQPRTFTVT